MGVAAQCLMAFAKRDPDEHEEAMAGAVLLARGLSTLDAILRSLTSGK